MGPDDRVLAGLSVAFDASCEEMWLAWRHGACLVPAPRSLVRSGMDLGPWLVSRDITVVSTVPTLAALWPAEALEAVRLLIFGGEACPPELAERLAVEGREVWNTYGPTEATVVACAARLDGAGPVSIGLPLRGWDLAVVDKDGVPVGIGEVGELVIGGVGLARYLDPDKDAEKYAAMPTLGWSRAYRSGDLVRLEPDGLFFVGRADDQVKVGGRRIELGEVDAALGEPARGQRRRCRGATDRQRHSPAGRLCRERRPDVRHRQGPRHAGRDAARRAGAAAGARRRAAHPHVGQGRPRRAALAAAGRTPGTDGAEEPDLGGTHGLAGRAVARRARRAGRRPGGRLLSRSAAGRCPRRSWWPRMRQRYPQVTVADLYDHPRLGSLAGYLDELDPPPAVETRVVKPTPRLTQAAQVALSLPLATLTGLQWVVWLALLNNVVAQLDPMPWLVPVNWWWIVAGFLLFVTPLGRMAIAALGARILLGGLEPGTYRRGGPVHLRVWLAERLAEASGAENLAGAPWLVYYARALGNKVGKGVDLHSAPPVTGMLTLGHRCSIEPEVDLSGHWIDGDHFHVGPITVGNDATIGARTTLLPGAVVGKNADVAPGSGVVGKVKNGQYWKGSPAVKSGKARHPWPDHRPRRAPLWVAMYGVTSILLGGVPLVALGAGLAVIGWAVRDTGVADRGDRTRRAVDTGGDTGCGADVCAC